MMFETELLIEPTKPALMMRPPFHPGAVHPAETKLHDGTVIKQTDGCWLVDVDYVPAALRSGWLGATEYRVARVLPGSPIPRDGKFQFEGHKDEPGEVVWIRSGEFLVTPANLYVARTQYQCAVVSIRGHS